MRVAAASDLAAQHALEDGHPSRVQRVAEGIAPHAVALPMFGPWTPGLDQRAPWGGYAGYFQDPDGHVWEIVFNPAFSATD